MLILEERRMNGLPLLGLAWEFGSSTCSRNELRVVRTYELMSLGSDYAMCYSIIYMIMLST